MINNKNLAKKSCIKRNTSVQGDTIEMKIEKIVDRKEPIKDSAPALYTNRKEGVIPETNVRTDVMEMAIVAMDNVSANVALRRDETLKKLEIVKDKPSDGTNE